MSKYQQIFKAMSEDAELEVSVAVGVWAKADYATVCELIGDNAVFSCRTPLSLSSHTGVTFPHPVSREEYTKNRYDTFYYVPDTADLTVREVSTGNVGQAHLDRLATANLLYLSEEDAQERLLAMKTVSRCVEYIVLYNGHETK